VWSYAARCLLVGPGLVDKMFVSVDVEDVDRDGES
jgi:hypothetical protein